MVTLNRPKKCGWDVILATVFTTPDKADVTVCGMSAFAVAIGGKADMAFCTAYVRF